MKKRGISALVVVTILAVFIGGAYYRNVVLSKEAKYKMFTAFFDVSGEERDSGNDIKAIIAEKTGAQCDETWLSGQTKESALNAYIASGEYPDFISGEQQLYEVGALLPVDEYWEDYPNIYNYMSQEEWDKFRLDDGHIYWIPQFGIVNGEECETIHEGEAFWIQTRVLKWAGYPEVRTLDQYFDLLEDYMAANPTMEDGTANIPYTILCDDWKYFCLENVPQFLDGYPNDGSCIVDPATATVMDYNVTDTAKRYFQKLNEEYKKGMVDPESFTSTYEEYVDKLCTGAVLGMVDQWWDFAYGIGAAYERQGLREQGCDYVPLPITIDESVQNQWHIKRSNELDTSTGISVTTSCQDVAGAFQFINDLLDQDVQNLRYWGVEGEDYSVNENGVFYLTDEQKQRSVNEELKVSHFCTYAYFPRREGMCLDGLNAFSPEYQADEFFSTLPGDVQECLAAYGCKNYVEMLGTNEKPGAWYPMYSYTTQLTYSTESGRVWKQMTEVKQQWLPQVVMAENFDSTWTSYLSAYNACNPQIFLDDMQREVFQRMGQE